MTLPQWHRTTKMGCEGGAGGGWDVTKLTGEVVLTTGFVGEIPCGCRMVSMTGVGVFMRED